MAMTLSGGTLYVGGGFSNIGGQPRRYAAALDTATGLATAWNANVDDWVFSVAACGGSVYLGGLFSNVGSEPHVGLAAVDPSTGAVLPWAADVDGVGRAFVASGNTVYVGGEFTTINGQPRNCLAALDAATGAVKPWDAHLWGSVANPTPAVNALALHGHTLYAAGDFYSLGGQVRPCLAAVDDSIGLATAWAPRANFKAVSLAISGNTLYAGGAFGSVGLLPHSGLAALSIPDDPIVTPPAFALAQNIPNPAWAGTRIRFTLPTTATTTLSVYDVQGRRIAMPLNHSLVQSGPHDVPMQLDGWKAGVYLYRLEAGGRTAARKMVVVR